VPKLIAATVFAMLWTACVSTGDATPGRTINLNKPGVLEALQQSNPTHYEKVRKIMEDVLQKPDDDVHRWIQTNFDARNVSYAPILLTSDPPKKRLSFALDDTRYEAVVTLTNLRGEIMPLK
jgi:hypothetical protein